MTAQEEDGSMKMLIIAVLVVFGLALATNGGGNTGAQDDSSVQQGVHRIDSYLQQGLTPETHEAIAKNARSSADWLRGIEQSAVDAAK